jgi:hypothetical protein
MNFVHFGIEIDLVDMLDMIMYHFDFDRYQGHMGYNQVDHLWDWNDL